MKNVYYKTVLFGEEIELTQFLVFRVREELFQLLLVILLVVHLLRSQRGEKDICFFAVGGITANYTVIGLTSEGLVKLRFFWVLGDLLQYLGCVIHCNRGERYRVSEECSHYSK